MAQHIGIEKMNESGETLIECEVNFAEVINASTEKLKAGEKYRLLAYIDPYGNTYFNRLQLPDLISELLSLSSSLKSGKLAANIEKVISFIKEIDVHQYLKFVGD